MLEGTAVVSAGDTAAPEAPEIPGTVEPRIVSVTRNVTSEARNKANRRTRAPANSDDSFRRGMRERQTIYSPGVHSASPHRRDPFTAIPSQIARSIRRQFGQ